MQMGRVLISYTPDMARCPKDLSFLQVARNAVTRAGMVPESIHYSIAHDHMPDDHLAPMRSCEIHMVLAGFQYGPIAPGRAASAIELEFEEAAAADVPQLVFLLDETAAVAPGPADAELAPVERFRRRLRRAGRAVRTFTSAADLEHEIGRTLGELSGDLSPDLPETSAAGFSVLLRQLRDEAQLTQEELADAAGVSARSVSDLERGKAKTPRRETARLLADALHLTGPRREAFEAAARGRVPAGAFPEAVASLHALPRDIASFTGREAQLAELVAAVASGGAPGGVVDIHAIGGMAGIGKTTLAVHAAHQLAERFPDGQLFLLLRGHTPGQPPMDPGDAVASLLQTIGLPAQQIPAGLEARTSLWRDRIAGRKLLLVLDDAVDSEQIRPLLPGTAGCLVLVTSRRRLLALEDATAITLDALPLAQASELLVRLAGRHGLRPDDAAVAEIARHCGCLPLAIGMMGRQLRHHPAWTPAGLASDLAAARHRLELMVTEDLSVAAAFDLSYRDLTPGQQLMFRRLGLHPGPEIDDYAARALCRTELAVARRHLTALYDQHLLIEPVPGRYRLHDLIREHARARSAADDQASDRDKATGWLLDYYQHAAEGADRYLTRYSRPGPAYTHPPLATAPVFSSRAQALTWLRAERANLLACLDLASDSGEHARVVALTAAIASLLRHDGPWAHAIARHTTAVRVARQLGDRPGEANALNDLAVVCHLTGDSDGAKASLDQALGIYRDLGERLGEANTLNQLANVRRLTGDSPGAASAVQMALSIYRDLGDRQGEANALSELGGFLYVTAEYHRAAGALEEALLIYDELGDRQGQATALNNLGNVRRLTGDYRGAAVALQEALGIYGEDGDRETRANALNLLGVVRRLTGDYRGAAVALQEALGIYRHLGDRQGEANALSFLGAVRRLTGDYPGAAAALDEALVIYRDLHDRGGEVEALNEVGTLHRLRGDLDRAEEYHQQALNLARDIPSAWDEAHALAGLGRCALAAGQRAAARTGLRRAQEIFQRIGAAETGEVSAEIEALPG